MTISRFSVLVVLVVSIPACLQAAAADDGPRRLGTRRGCERRLTVEDSKSGGAVPARLVAVRAGGKATAPVLINIENISISGDGVTSRPTITIQAQTRVTRLEVWMTATDGLAATGEQRWTFDTPEDVVRVQPTVTETGEGERRLSVFVTLTFVDNRTETGSEVFLLRPEVGLPTGLAFDPQRLGYLKVVSPSTGRLIQIRAGTF